MKQGERKLETARAGETDPRSLAVESSAGRWGVTGGGDLTLMQDVDFVQWQFLTLLSPRDGRA